MEDKLYGVIIKSKIEAKTKSGDTFYKFVIVDGNEEHNMNCFEEDIPKMFSPGDKVNIDIVKRGSFVNIKSIESANELPIEEMSVGEEEVQQETESPVQQHVEEVTTNTAVHQDNFSPSPNNRNNYDINEEFIVSIQGKEYITINGLLEIAKQLGGVKTIEIVDKKLDHERNSAEAHARVVMNDERVFENLGSANPNNLNSMVKPYFVEMACTRAIARALRFGLNVDYCSVEELSS